MNATGDRVDAAMAAVPQDQYVLQPDGLLLPQTTNPTLVADMLRLLEVAPDARVLEIGTGSGYSTALLSRLVGPTGSVTSLDVDETLVARARCLLNEPLAEASNVVLVAGDGRAGHPAGAPFDCLIAWATGDALPLAWAEQMKVGGVLVAPVQVAPLGHAVAVVRARRRSGDSLVGERLIAGSFVPLSDATPEHWAGPPPHADVVLSAPGSGAAFPPLAEWLSGAWLRTLNGDTDSENAARIRELCRGLSPSCLGPLHTAEDAEAFRAYLLARLPGGLTTAFFAATGQAIGCGNPASLALLSRRGGGLVQAGDDTATRTLARWAEDWRACGQPSFTALRPLLTRTEQGWAVRAERTAAAETQTRPS